MTTQLVLIAGLAVSFFVALFLSRREGNKAAQLEALKKELKRIEKEKELADKVTNNVANFDEHTVRQKLHGIANGLKK